MEFRLLGVRPMQAKDDYTSMSAVYQSLLLAEAIDAGRLMSQPSPLLDPGCLQYAQYDPTIEVEQTAVKAQQFAFEGRYCVPDFSGYVTGVQTIRSTLRAPIAGKSGDRSTTASARGMRGQDGRP